MSDLTEVEIFDCMALNLRLAAEHCRALAIAPARGPLYVKLRDELRLAEGCCRQAAAWRGDYRWLMLSMQLREAHDRSGNWLRTYIGPDGRKRAHPLFLKLAEVLVTGHKAALELKTRATGRVGLMLPEPQPGPHRDTRPVQIIMPAAHA